jgi:hypothetical protein
MKLTKDVHDTLFGDAESLFEQDNDSFERGTLTLRTCYYLISPCFLITLLLLSSHQLSASPFQLEKRRIGVPL